jgi:hypothetical protein
MLGERRHQWHLKDLHDLASSIKVTGMLLPSSVISYNTPKSAVSLFL